MIDGLNSCYYFGSIYSNYCLSKDKNRQVLKAFNPSTAEEAPQEF